MAGKAKATEHAGAKHGNGAYWGRKVDAKHESNKARRTADRDETDPEWQMILDGAEDALAQVWCDRCDLPAIRQIRLTNGTLAFRCAQHAWLIIAPRGR